MTTSLHAPVMPETDAAGPAITPVAVFGKDQRRALPRSLKQLASQVGLLHNSRTNTLCTAFCVGPDIIATASHCLFGRYKKRRLHLSSVVFKLSGRKAASPAQSRLAGHASRQARRYVIAGTSSLNRKPPIGAARDWALARLARPACKNGWLTTANLSDEAMQRANSNNKLFQVAFHMDYRNWELAFSRSCPVSKNFGGLSWTAIRKHFSSPRSLILHRCDTGEASSGSPLLMEGENGPVVVGINVGTYQQREVTIKNGRIIRHTKYRTIANTAVSSAAFFKKISILGKARIIQDRARLKQLQKVLKLRGLYLGKIDGVYGSRTEQAIKAHERRAGLPVTGLATVSILATFDKTTPAAISTSEGKATGNRVRN